MDRMLVTHRVGVATALALCLTVAACHRDAPDHMARGKQAMAKGDHAAAIIEFRNVLQNDKSVSEARFLLGSELLAQGDPKNAEIELQKAYDAQFDPDRVLPLLASSQILQGATEKVAAQIAKTPLKTPQANAAMQALLGSAFMSSGNLDKAMVAYKAARALVPDQPEAMLGEARIRAMRGDTAGATEEVASVLAKDPKLVEALILKGELEQARGAPKEAIQSYQAAIAQNPKSFTARLNLAGALVADKQLDPAQQEVDALKKVAPKHPGVAYLDALIAFEKKDFTRANDAIAIALASAPKSGVGQLLAGAISSALNQPAQAESHLSDAIAINPQSIYARKLLTGLYLRQRQTNKAEDTLAPALKAAPDDPVIVSLAGELAVAKGDFANAAKYFDRATAINPADTNARTKGAVVDFARGDEAAGFAALETASKLAVNNPSPDIALVLARIQRRQFDQAVTAWKTLEKRQPDNPITYNLRAAIDLGKGDVAGSSKALERAVQLDATYFPAVANLAALDEREKNIDGARQRFKALLAKDPGNLSGLLSLAKFEGRQNASADVIVGLLKEARTRNPSSPLPVTALAEYYAQNGNAKQALVVAQEGLASAPNNAAYMNMVAQLLVATGSTDQGVAMFRKLAAQNPESMEAQMRLGMAQVAANLPTEALQTFTNVVKSKPDAYGVQSASVTALLRIGKVADATTLTRTIRQVSPKSPALPELEADIQLAGRHFAEAAALYRKLYAQAPSSGLVVKTHTSLSLAGNVPEANALLAAWLKSHPKDVTVRMFDAEIALRENDYTRATIDYRSALEGRPDDPVALNNLAWAMWQLKDPQALALAQRANALAPNSPQIGDTLGWMLVEQGQTKRGLELLQKARAAAPAQREIALHLAKAQIKDGRKDAARATLQELVDEAPESIEGKESKILMATL